MNAFMAMLLVAIVIWFIKLSQKNYEKCKAEEVVEVVLLLAYSTVLFGGIGYAIFGVVKYITKGSL